MESTHKDGADEAVESQGLELHEHYFHSQRELHSVLRAHGFDLRSRNEPVAVERRRTA